jgi:hypothetical protein
VDHHSGALCRGLERAIEYCWVHNDDDRLPELAAEARETNSPVGIASLSAPSSSLHLQAAARPFLTGS